MCDRYAIPHIKVKSMIFIFFQNCLSPHQIPYIRECAKDERVEKVYFVMPRVDYGARADMGWSNERLLLEPTIEFTFQPTDDDVKRIFARHSRNDLRCFFSGIRGDADVFRWLNISLEFDVKRYIITEPPFTFDKPLWMHYVRFFLQDYKYVKHIDGIFAIGESCVKYYRSLSKHWKVFPFLYVTESTDVVPVQLCGEMKVLYIGSLSERKNVQLLITALKGFRNVHLNIVGDGEKRQELEGLAEKYGVDATFLGTKNMAEVPKELQKNDILVLPSLYDGWGAVVNEALTQGLYVVCSNKCGAKDLLHETWRGLVFKNNNANDLTSVLEQCQQNINAIRCDRQRRSDWARNNISGPVIAKYVIDCMDGTIIDCIWKVKE